MTRGCLPLRSGGAGPRRGLPPLAAGVLPTPRELTLSWRPWDFAHVARPYPVVLSALLALAFFANDDPEIMTA